MGYIVLDKVCDQLNAINPEGYDIFRIAVNISAIQFLQPHFVEHAMDIIRMHNVKPEQLQFEITESVLINSLELVKSIMQELRALGIDFSLDDFGTGYSSLAYLLHLPITTLKLDRSFIEPLEESEVTQGVCKAIVSIAQQFNMEVVAEGVETEAQARIISTLGASSIQGYYYARPLPSGHLIQWLSRNTERIHAERETL